jgi:signal transduction histidine kinase
LRFGAVLWRRERWRSPDLPRWSALLKPTLLELQRRRILRGRPDLTSSNPSGRDSHHGLEDGPAVRETVYFVLREALHNIATHAGADHVRVRLATDPERIRLEVEDDGKGFDPASQRGGGHGLVGMRERAALAGGTLDVRSAPGEGTTIILTMSRRIAGQGYAGQGAPEFPTEVGEG